MFRSVVTTIAVLAFGPNETMGCCAQDGPALDRALEQRLRQAETEIPSVIKRYAEAIGCAFQLLPSNITRFELNGRDDVIAVFYLDNGCSGGNKMWRPVFALLQPDGFRMRYVVSASHSAPHQTSRDFPQTITRIYPEEGHLKFAGEEHLDRTVISGRVVFENGMWQPIFD
jgi:hypothetical protein